MNAPMTYRSVSFHEGWPRPELVALAARLGFNDCTFQTEKGTMPRLRDLARRNREQGLFALARRHGMTVSVWTHEIGEPEPAWRPITADNARLWKGLRERYDHVLGELLPEIDNLVLTVVEAGVDIAEARLLPKIVETVAGACRAHGKRLILRTFVHHPEQMEAVTAAVKSLPEDVAVITKCVPQDWHMRQGHHPLIGEVGEREQFIECDIAGEYWQEDRLANAFTHIIEPRFRHWRRRGADGISVRVDRGWRPWQHQATVLGEAQEANLWFLGLAASGQVADADEAWRRYAEDRFGPDAGPLMIDALRPTGRVVEEASHVGREAFGLLRKDVPTQETFDGVPSWKRGLLASGRIQRPVAEAYDDGDDAMYRNPFYGYASVHRWEPPAKPAYHRLRRGDPEMIKAKTRAAADADDLARGSLESLEAAREHLDPAAYHHYRWRLQENRLYLSVMTEMQLAWLNAERALYCDSEDEARGRRRAVEGHLAELARIQAVRGDETWRGTWDHRHQERRRLEGRDIPGFLRGFRRYFRIGTDG